MDTGCVADVHEGIQSMIEEPPGMFMPAIAATDWGADPIAR